MEKLLMVIPLAILLCFTFGCQQQGKEGINEEDAKAVFVSVQEIWNDGQLDLIEDVFAPEIVARTSSFPEDIVGFMGYEN